MTNVGYLQKNNDVDMDFSEPEHLYKQNKQWSLL